MNAPSAFPDQQKPVPPYKHTPLFPLGNDTTPYKKITTEGVRVENVLGKDMLVVSREALRALSEAAFGDINHYLRPGHLKQLRSILDDKEASDNDKFVAFDFLKNANIAAGGVLPMCQDTGTAIIMGKNGGSANNSFLFQSTPSVLTKDRLLAFLKEKVLTLGTAACPPYHLAIV